MDISADFLVIGSGIAGLRAALTLAESGTVTVLTKADPRESNTGYAQGGIAAALGGDDSPELHAKDTVAAGDGLCNPAAVDVLTREGPKLIEYNVRFGDPECQVLMVRLMSDLLPALIAARDGNLDQLDLRWFKDAALTVVMAAEGYPDAPKTGGAIAGLDGAAEIAGVTIFHAATKQEGGRLVASGGRVLSVTGQGPDIGAARTRAYQAIDRIGFPTGFCRRDIGWRALERVR